MGDANGAVSVNAWEGDRLWGLYEYRGEACGHLGGA
jgi:hypothetical protein